MASGQTNITGGKTLVGTAQPSDVRMGMTYPDGKELRNGTLDLTNLTPENIRSGVTIGGVVGVLEDISKLSGFLKLFSQNNEGSFGIQAPEGATKALVIMAGGGGGGGGGGGSPNTAPSTPDIMYFGCGGGGGGGGAGSFTWFIDKNRGAAGGDGGYGGHGGGGYSGHLVETAHGGSGYGGSIVVDTFDVKAGTYYYGAVGGGGNPGIGGFGGRSLSSNGSRDVDPRFTGDGGLGGRGGSYGTTPNEVSSSSGYGGDGKQGHYGYRYGGGGSGGVYSGIGKKTKFKAKNGGYRGSGAYSSFNSRGSDGYSGDKGQSGYIHILFFC